MISMSDKPRLRACIFSFDADHNSLFVRKGIEAYKVNLKEERENDFWNIKKYLNGYYTVEDISDITNIDSSEIIKTIDSLNQVGLLVSSKSTGVIASKNFKEKMRSSISMWRIHMLQHDLFRLLVSSDTPKEVLIGLILETYHSVAAAPEIIGTAISNCKYKKHISILKKLYDNESKHDQIIRKAANNVGISNEQLDSSCPLSSTNALIYYKKEIARTDSLMFLICFSFSEAKIDENSNALCYLKKLSVNHGYIDSTLDPIYEHMSIDLKAGHSEIFSEAFNGIDYIEERRADEIINQVHLLKHCFDNYHTGILHY